MQNKTSRKIIDKLRSKNERILSKEEIIKTIRDYQKIYKRKVNIISLWTYLRKNNYIKRILKDFYYIYSLEERHNHYCRLSEGELIFLALEKLRIEWYLGLENALKENKISWQALNITIIINNKFSGIKTLGNSKFKFIKTKPSLFFGLIKKKTNNKVLYSYSDLEKTYLDFLYFYSYKGEKVEIIKKDLDFEIVKYRLIEYAKKYPKKIQEAI
ncbi:hypothetical protein HYT56_05470 [Candidatus Woesearchaeota archaeon]|nr:hypothetical protein [Candidatus Woesearchaeota archaeon]